MREIFLEKGDEHKCPHCEKVVVHSVKETVYLSDYIADLGYKCRLHTITVYRSDTKIEDAKSKCTYCDGNVYENLISKINYLLPDELFEI